MPGAACRGERRRRPVTDDLNVFARRASSTTDNRDAAPPSGAESEEDLSATETTRKSRRFLQ